MMCTLTQGSHRLHVTSEDYHRTLAKKKESEVIEAEDKLLPIDALGVVMIQHGEEFGDDSAFGPFFQLKRVATESS